MWYWYRSTILPLTVTTHSATKPVSTQITALNVQVFPTNKGHTAVEQILVRQCFVEYTADGLLQQTKARPCWAYSL